MIEQDFEEKVYQMRDRLSEITGCQVQVKPLGTKRLVKLFRVEIIIPIPNHPIGNLVESFDLYQCIRGRVYWDRARDINENLYMKDIN
ncbi:MAG: hypothetical protein GOVbin2917_92 [Prokaryotic dsDNA virus sp.]|jgi:ribosome-associated translation inhibitor RaiA|nr:MAG: hypothetical protein GOVbin2917_92 [Prokaryotic dsDNA virus sp.]|tara:strand:- start:40138 stop:40401 length:264 start_codon:yes stop_codon:yes gene_type:complete